MLEFEGRVAVVTGAASGIGRGLAERFAAEKMRVVLADIEEPPLAEAARALEQNGASVLAQRVDVSKAEDVEALAEAVYSKFGAANIVCNNAGVGAPGGLCWMHPLSTWRWLIDVNLFGVIHGIHSFVPRMLDGGEEGHIVNTASVAGVTSGPLMGPYHVPKHGVVTLSETLYAELQMTGARLGVSVLCPGFVRTRIAESLRNKPADLEVLEGSEEFREYIEARIAEGTPPAQIAEHVVAAIRENRFWILTHKEFDAAIQARGDSMIRRTNPIPRVEVEAAEAGS